MAGFVVDIVLAYLFKSVARWIRFYQSANWKYGRAVVVDQSVLSPWVGCPSVKVMFEMTSGGKSLGVADEIPFLSLTSAKSYATRFHRGLAVIVRVDPKDPSHLYFYEADQARQILIWD